MSGTSCTAEGFEVEGQLLNALPSLIIMLGVLWTRNECHRLLFGHLRQKDKLNEAPSERYEILRLHCLVNAIKMPHLTPDQL